jgi:hypothetical protein
MLNRLKFLLGVVTLFLFAAWAPSHLHAQVTPPSTEVGQQGEFQGENTDTGAAAVDDVNEKAEPDEKGTEPGEVAEPTGTMAGVSPASAHAAGVTGAEPPENDTDTDRIEDQVGDQTTPDTPGR